MAKGGSGIDDDAPDDMKKSGEDDFGGGGGGGTVGSADVSEEGPAIVKVDIFCSKRIKLQQFYGLENINIHQKYGK